MKSKLKSAIYVFIIIFCVSVIMVKFLGYHGRYDLGDTTFGSISWVKVYDILPNIICANLVMTILWYIIVSQNNSKKNDKNK